MTTIDFSTLTSQTDFSVYDLDNLIQIANFLNVGVYNTEPDQIHPDDFSSVKDFQDQINDLVKKFPNADLEKSTIELGSYSSYDCTIDFYFASLMTKDEIITLITKDLSNRERAKKAKAENRKKAAQKK
jgi:hypothetical protein